MVKKDKAKVKKSKAVVSCDKVLTAAASTTKPANDKLDPYQPHDKFAKCAFKNKAIAVDFFAAHLKNTGLNGEELQNFDLRVYSNP